jgi:hypothetical protein
MSVQECERNGEHVEMTDDRQPVNMNDHDARLRQRLDISLVEAQAQLPGWDVWMIRGTVRDPTYSAKPSGAKTAIPTCQGLYDLTALVFEARKYEQEIDTHIEIMRRELALMDEWGSQREVLASRLTASLKLREKLRAN